MFLEKVIYNKYSLFFAIVLWLVLQVLYVFHNKYDALVSDSGTYVLLARSCAETGTMYPNFSNLYDHYIFNPGWVNLMIVWMKLFGDTKELPYLQVVFNLVIVCLLFQLCRVLYGDKKVAYIAVYSYLLLPSFFSISSHLYSEPFFAATSMAVLYVCVLNNRFCYLAGFFAAVGVWIRPIGIGWLIACIYWYLWKKRSWRLAAKCLMTYIGTCLFISILTHQNYPNYTYKATTGGVNLIMGANDNATGGYNTQVFSKGEIGYIPRESYEKLTVNEKDSIWMHRAVQWIWSHPRQYCVLTLKKLYSLYSSTPTFLYNYKTAPPSAKKELISSRSYCSQATLLFSPYSEKMISFLSSYYFKALMLLVACGLFLYSWKRKGLMYVYIPIISCTLLTMLTVGEPRYNMVMLPLISIAFSYSFVRIFKNIVECLKLRKQ